MIRQYQMVLLATVALLTGCVSQANSEKMYEKASALTKVSSALEAAVYFDNPPEGLQDRALLEYATKHDPQLLEPFDSLTLKASYTNRHGVVLVCDEQGLEAFMQDLGCTAKLDEHYWQTAGSELCEIDHNATAKCPSGSH
jgi:hypothetical protein